MKPDALHMLASQLRRDPNPDAIEDAAAALEALAIGRERLRGAPEIVSGGESRRSIPVLAETDAKPPVADRHDGRYSR